MKTLITLSPLPAMANALRVSLDASEWRVIHHENSLQRGLLQIPGSVDAMVLECDLEDVLPIRQIEKLVKLQPGIPIFIYKNRSQPEWEEEAYLAGAHYIISKPVRGRLLTALLEKSIPQKKGELAAPGKESFLSGPAALRDRPTDSSKTLATLRSFSQVLTHSLASGTLPRQFLQLLREVLGVNKAAIFLKQPSFSVNADLFDPGADRLQSACSIGLPVGLLDYFDLSLSGGIGGHLHRFGRILNRRADDALGNEEIQKEFDLLGVGVAVPILDRESLIGIAVFDERMTGEPFSSAELTLVFHALEELGLAIRNSWLYDQLNNNHDLLNEVLDKLSSGCIVLDQELTVLHENPAARGLLALSGKAQLQFSDLPQAIGSRIFEALKTGAAIASFRYVPPDKPAASYHISVTPFRREKNTEAAALLLIEDFTLIQQAQTLEIETSNLRTVRSMAEHLSHEIGNALVPMSTHQQLLDEQYDDADFRGSLSLALAQGIKRISRLSNQLLFLTRDDVSKQDSIPAVSLLKDAFADAQLLYGLNGRKLVIDQPEPVVNLIGNRASLQHALSETLLNALQSSPADSAINIHFETADEKENGAARASIQIIDKGPGFTTDLAAKAANPFFSTRTVGPGLGLTVAKKIIENHHGALSLVTGESRGSVLITLPSRGGLEKKLRNGSASSEIN